MGAESYFGQNGFGGGFVTDSPFLTTPTTSWAGGQSPRARPYPLPGVSKLARLRPPKRLAAAVHLAVAHAVDAVETFGLRVGATYDDHIEPLLDEWQS